MKLHPFLRALKSVIQWKTEPWELAGFPTFPVEIFLYETSLQLPKGRCWGKALMPLECLFILGQTSNLQDPKHPNSIWLTLNHLWSVLCHRLPPESLHLQVCLLPSYHGACNCHGSTGDINPKHLPQGCSLSTSTWPWLASDSFVFVPQPKWEEACEIFLNWSPN